MDGLKQRIIGALVLVSLAVIFVPMMFDEPHSERESTTIKIPEEPPFPEVDAPEPELSDAPAYRLEESDAAGEPDSTPQPSNDQPTPDADMAGTDLNLSPMPSKNLRILQSQRHLKSRRHPPPPAPLIRPLRRIQRSIPARWKARGLSSWAVLAVVITPGGCVTRFVTRVTTPTCSR